MGCLTELKYGAGGRFEITESTFARNNQALKAKVLMN
jgi:hypothetical protein